jgi:hypothetical protein
MCDTGSNFRDVASLWMLLFTATFRMILVCITWNERHGTVILRNQFIRKRYLVMASSTWTPLSVYVQSHLGLYLDAKGTMRAWPAPSISAKPLATEGFSATQRTLLLRFDMVKVVALQIWQRMRHGGPLLCPSLKLCPSFP